MMAVKMCPSFYRSSNTIMVMAFPMIVNKAQKHKSQSSILIEACPRIRSKKI